MNVITKNTPLYILWFLKDFALFQGIITIFYISHALSEIQIFWLVVIYQAGILFAEIPTGYIASRFGDKNSIFLGILFQIFALCGWYFWENFLHFVIIQIIFAISIAFLSGSFSTFIANFCQNTNQDFVILRSKIRSIGLISGIIATSISGFLLFLGFKNIFLIQICIFLVALMFLQTIPSYTSLEKKLKNFSEIFAKWRQVLQIPNILFPSIFVFGMLAVEAMVFTAFQTQYIFLWWNETFLGISLVAFTLVSIIFLKFFEKNPKYFSESIFSIIALIFIISSVCNIFSENIFLLFLLLWTQIIRPMDILIENTVFENISDNSGSFIISLLGFFERMIFVLIVWVMTIFDLRAIETIWIFSLILWGYWMFIKKWAT